MNRTSRFAAAAGGALCLAAAGASAQAPTAPPSSVRLHGIVDVSAGRFQEPGAGHVHRVEGGGLSPSHFGLTGSEDLGGGLQLRFSLESYLRADTGASGRSGADPFFSRNAYVGLSGAFGTTVIGRNTTPLFASTVLFNAFGESFAFSPSVRQYFTAPALPGGTPTRTVGDTVWDNSLLYASPRSDGWGYTLAFNAGEGGANAVGRNVGGNVTYFKGAGGFSLAAQQVKNSPTVLPAGFLRQNTFQLGGSYDMGVAKAYGQYGRIRTETRLAATDSRTKLWGLGLSVPLGGGRVLGQIGRAETEGGGAFAPASLRTTTVGYDYFLSRTTDVYALYMHEKASYAARDGNTLAAGLRMRF